jgi:hypothetical protein
VIRVSRRLHVVTSLHFVLDVSYPSTKTRLVAHIVSWTFCASSTLHSRVKDMRNYIGVETVHSKKGAKWFMISNLKNTRKDMKSLAGCDRPNC